MAERFIKCDSCPVNGYIRVNYEVVGPDKQIPVSNLPNLSHRTSCTRLNYAPQGTNGIGTCWVNPQANTAESQ